MDDERLSSFFSKGTYTKGKVSNLNLLLHSGPPRKFMNPEAPGKRGRGGPLRANRADNFYGLELYYGSLLLAYLMRPHTLKNLVLLGPLDLDPPGQFPPCLPSRWPWLHDYHVIKL